MLNLNEPSQEAPQACQSVDGHIDHMGGRQLRSTIRSSSERTPSTKRCAGGSEMRSAAWETQAADSGPECRLSLNSVIVE